MRCVVLGGAACIFDDFEAAHALHPDDFHEVVAVNEVGAVYERTTVWITLHPDKFPGAIAPSDDFPELWTPGGSTGSSGLFAVRYAIERLGASRVVLCGVPMDSQPHFYGGEPWAGADAMWPAWEAALPFMAGKVRSMSGRTRELLGAPDAAWLSENDAVA